MSIFDRHPLPWSVDYDNDVGPGDESFWEWWSINDAAGAEITRFSAEQDANDMCAMANQRKDTTMSKPDFEKMGCDLAGMVSEREQATAINAALQAAFDAGLERAAEITLIKAADCYRSDNTGDGGALMRQAEAIRAEKSHESSKGRHGYAD